MHIRYQYKVYVSYRCLLLDVTTNFNTTGSASEGSERCAGNRGNFGGKDDCTEEGNGNSLVYYALFILGMVVAGSGCTPMYALGIPYVDENVKAKVAPMYVGIFVAAGIIGKLPWQRSAHLLIFIRNTNARNM